MVPTADALDTDGLAMDPKDLDELLSVNSSSWKQEVDLISEHFDFIGERLPMAMSNELDGLRNRLAE